MRRLLLLFMLTTPMLATFGAAERGPFTLAAGSEPGQIAIQAPRQPVLPQGTGNPLHTTFFSQPCADSGYGITFDGQNLWYGCSYTKNIYKANALSGAVLASFTPNVDYLGALAWDQKRQSLWAGELDSSTWAVNMNLIDPTTGNATLAFSLPRPPYYQYISLAYDPHDDTLYMSTYDPNAVFHLDTSGAVLGSWALGEIAVGLAIAGDLLYVAHGDEDTQSIAAYDKASGTYQFEFNTIERGNRDLECDSVTFSPLTALWAVNYPDPRRATAYEIPPESCTRPWTLMFYLAGDNNLAHTYPQIIQQLQSAATNPNVNIVALWDAASSGDSDYYKFHATGVDITAQGELNMSNPTTLINFVNWARTNYPAQHYALLLDNHGSGVSGGLVDDTSFGLRMSVPQMGDALNAITNNGTDKIDVLVMNMCLMAMIEDAYEVQNYIDYYVASENIQWSYSTGYYTYISGITASTTPVQFATDVVNGYANDASPKSYTMSAADISQLGNLVNSTNSLALLLTSQITTTATILTNVRQEVQRYDNKDPDGIDTADQYIDLYDFAERIKAASGDTSIQNAAQGVMDAVNGYIIAERHLSRLRRWVRRL